MTQQALYLNLTVHFQQRAPVRSLDDKHRHTDGALYSFIEALVALAAFAEPVLSYIGQQVAGHLIDRATDAALTKAQECANKFRSSGLKELRSGPPVNAEPQKVEEIAERADEFTEVLIAQSAALGPDDLETAFEQGRLAAERLLSSELNFDKEDSYRVSIAIVVDVRRSVTAAATHPE